MAISTSLINQTCAGRAFTNARPSLRPRVSRSALVCKASQENKGDVILKAAGAALGALAAVQLGLAGPALADVSFDSSRSGAPPQNKDAVNLPSSFFKTGDTLQEKLGFTEDAQNQGDKVGKPSFSNASQEDAKIEKTAKSAQKGLEKSAQNIIPDTSELPNPLAGLGDKASGAAKDATKKLNPNSTDLPSLGGAADKGAGNVKDAANSAKSSSKNLASDLSENPLAGLGDKASGAVKDATKKLNPNSTDLPSLGGAADKAAGNLKGTASDAKSAAKNVASDLSENPLAGLGDKASGAAKDATKKLNPNSTDLPSLGGAADKAVGNVKDAANSAKSSAKNLASDLSENPLAGLGDKAKGAAKDVGKTFSPSESNPPSVGGATDRATGDLKSAASDAKSKAKNLASDVSENPLAGLGDKASGAAKDATKKLNPNSTDLPSLGGATDKAVGNVKDAANQAKSGAKNLASDLSENPLDNLSNPFDGPGGLAEKAKGTAKDVAKNLNPSESNLPDPSAAADKISGNAKDFAADAKSTVKGLKSNPNT